METTAPAKGEGYTFDGWIKSPEALTAEGPAGFASLRGLLLFRF